MSIIEKAVDRLDSLEEQGARQRDLRVRVGKPAQVLEARPDPMQGERVSSRESASVPEQLVDGALARLADEPIRDLPGSGEGKRSREVKIDLARLKASGILTSGDSESQIAEECRLVKRPLLQFAFGEDSIARERRNLVMVTSSVPGEGKTFLSVSLAMSMATELDRTVLLVDGDVIRGSVSEIMGVEPGEGLTDVLAGKVTDLADVLLKTDVPKLTLLPAGRPYPNSTELLASDGMRAVVDDLSRRYSDRIVIFDSPPLLAASGASVLARLMGQVALVVEAERTPRRAVKEAIRLLSGCHIAGVVLNKTRSRIWGGRGYGYGYNYSYYGYGYKGYGHGRAATTPPDP
jgi:receptor protein-tyrosine kinase